MNIELGGHWGDETATFLKHLAHTEARQASGFLRHTLADNLIQSWRTMRIHAATHAFAVSLVDKNSSGCHNIQVTDHYTENIWKSMTFSFENLFVALWGLHRAQIGQHNGMIFCMGGKYAWITGPMPAEFFLGQRNA